MKEFDLNKIGKLVEDYLSDSLSQAGREHLEQFLHADLDLADPAVSKYRTLLNGLYYTREPVQPAEGVKDRILDHIKVEDAANGHESTGLADAFISIRSYEGQWVTIGRGLTAKYLFEDKVRSAFQHLRITVSHFLKFLWTTQRSWRPLR